MTAPSEELEQLVAGYVAGEADRAQVERLTCLLEERKEARDYFLAWMDLHAGMTVDESLRRKATAGTGPGPAAGMAPEEPASQSATVVRSKWVVPAMAACAAGLVLVVVGLLNRAGDRGIGPVAQDPDATGYVAVMTDAEDVVWKMDGHVPRDVGEAVGTVTAELVSGRAEFQFGSGARVAIAGPAVLGFLSANRARLHRGQLTAYVPGQARGFTVEIDGAKVVDLGTEFAVNSDGQDTVEVHVYDGEVVVMPDARSDPLTLRANDTKRLGTREGVVEDALFESARFLRMHRSPDLPEPTGDIRFLNRGPRSVLQGAFEHSRYILLFREREEVVLQDDILVNAAAPGTYRTRRKPEDPPGTAVAVEVGRPESESRAYLAAGTKVSSYFVHFDPARGGGGLGVHRGGSIRFEEPILGVIMATRHLVPTDGVFGRPETRYETTDFAIARNGLEPSDRVVLDPDRRTIHLELGAGTSVDHLRILVGGKVPAERDVDQKREQENRR